MITIKEQFIGSDGTGSDGDVNRTLTLSNTSLTDNDNFNVFVSNLYLHRSVDYSVVHNESGTVITFLNSLWNSQNVSVTYGVQVQTLRETNSESYTGADCTGSNGDTSRTLTISNTSLTNQDGFLVYINNQYLHLNIDYTIVHNSSSSVITFVNSVYDAQNIIVKYSSKTSTLSTTTGILPLDSQHINNEINYFGDTIIVRAVTKLDNDDRGNAQEVLGDSKICYTSGDDALLSFYGANYISQTFTTGSDTMNTTSIKLKLKRTGTPGALTVSIKAVDGNGKPTGSALTSGSLDYTDLITDGETAWIGLPLTDYTLSASTTYALVISSSGGDSSNKYDARIKTTGTYSGGNSLTSTDSGSTWTVGSSDILFDLYGDTIARAMVDILSMEDDVVKYGQFQSGDIRLNFQNSENNIVRGTRLKYRNIWYQIDEINIDSFGDINYWSEALARKI